MNVLDIDVKFFPCPKNGPTWRKQVKETTGKSQFPYMKDPNTGGCEEGGRMRGRAPECGGMRRV